MEADKDRYERALAARQQKVEADKQRKKDEILQIMREAQPSWKDNGGTILGKPEVVRHGNEATGFQSQATVFTSRPAPIATDITQAISTTTSAADFPFKINDKGHGVFSVSAGLIGNTVPTLDSVAIASDVTHTLDEEGAQKILLKVNIVMESDNYHPSIEDAEVVVLSADDPDITPDFQVTWEDPDNKVSGAFFILIADIEVETTTGDDPHLNIASKDQWLNQSYRSLVLVGGEAVDVAYVL